MASPDYSICRLTDGRKLAYREYGDRAGTPVVYCHGLPASRFEAGVLDHAARNLAIRLIAPERPGFGHSDAYTYGCLHNHALDLVRLADTLCIERFALFGMSAGGPHALACAHAASARITRIALAGPLGPCYHPWAVNELRLHGRTAFRLARYAPCLLWPTYGLFTMLALRYVPRATLYTIHRFSPAADRRALRQPTIQQLLLRSMVESMRQGPTPALQELALLGRDWGFRLQDITLPVTLWHGLADQVVPVSHARYYASALPQVGLNLLPDESHFSVLIEHGPAILAYLKAGRS